MSGLSLFILFRIYAMRKCPQYVFATSAKFGGKKSDLLFQAVSSPLIGGENLVGDLLREDDLWIHILGGASIT